MNKVIIQLWEYYEKKEDNKSIIRPSGCSIHIDSYERKRYVKSILESRDLNFIPNEYENTLGEEMEVFIKDDLFKILQNEKTIRLQENQLNNLINMGELIRYKIQ